MKQLTHPIQIKNVDISNRIVMPPMATGKAAQGQVSQPILDYYNEKSKGGHIGLIITEHLYISKEGMAHNGQMSIERDSDLAGLSRLAEIIHRNGSKVIAQINHAGRAANSQLTGKQALCVSSISSSDTSGEASLPPKEMDQADIDRIVVCFASAAKRAKDAGFDGVEIHSAHGYFLSQFYSPLTNRRIDGYGGTLEGRIRIHLEIIRAVREAVGEDYVIALRLGACDYTEGGITLEDSVAAARAFEKAGVDVLDISGGVCGFSRPGHQEPGYFAELTEAIKNVVSIPVILTGGITTGVDADRLLAEQKADLIGVGRAILNDSDWARKAVE